MRQAHSQHSGQLAAADQARAQHAQLLRLDDEKERLRAHFGREIQALEEALHATNRRLQLSESEGEAAQQMLHGDVRELEAELREARRVASEGVAAGDEQRAAALEQLAREREASASLKEEASRLEARAHEARRAHAEEVKRVKDEAERTRDAELANVRAEAAQASEAHGLALRAAKVDYEKREQEAQAQAAQAVHVATLSQLSTMQQQQQLAAEQHSARDREIAAVRSQLDESRERGHNLQAEVRLSPLTLSVCHALMLTVHACSHRLQLVALETRLD